MKKYKRNSNEKEYIPSNPERYCGTYPIICRSSWEYKMCRWFDLNETVVEWSSENHRIKYIDPTSRTGKKVRTYYPDFYALFKNKRRCIVEVKPEKDLRLPRKKGGKSQKTMNTRGKTFLINEAKFKAARNYCKKLGYEFVIITEKNLFR